MASFSPTPSDVALVVMTVNRNPQYVHQTLASLFAADPLVHGIEKVWVMVGSDDWSYLRHYLHHEKLKITPLSPEEARKIADWRLERRFNHNYRRCLSIPLDGKKGVIIAEDDVVFRDGFLSRLLDTIAEIEGEHSITDYALALFAAYDFESDASFYRGGLFCSYGFEFYGTPCMYYPRAVAYYLADFIGKHGVENDEEPGDMLVKRAYGARMYSCCRALAQHVGEVSTGLGGGGGTVRFNRPYKRVSSAEWGRPEPGVVVEPVADHDGDRAGEVQRSTG